MIQFSISSVDAKYLRRIADAKGLREDDLAYDYLIHGIEGDLENVELAASDRCSSIEIPCNGRVRVVININVLP